MAESAHQRDYLEISPCLECCAKAEEIEQLRIGLNLVRSLLKGQPGAVAASLRAICSDSLGSLKEAKPDG